MQKGFSWEIGKRRCHPEQEEATLQ